METEEILEAPIEDKLEKSQCAIDHIIKMNQIDDSIEPPMKKARKGVSLSEQFDSIIQRSTEPGFYLN